MTQTKEPNLGHDDCLLFGKTVDELTLDMIVVTRST